MENVIINKNMVKRNKAVKLAQKKAKKYYGEKLFSSSKNTPKAKLRKLVDITDLQFVSMLDENKAVASDINVEKRIESATRDSIIGLCQNAGLTGRSGNGYATADKLRSFDKQNGILIINAVECDPGLVHDAWIYRNRFSMIELGARILNKAFNFDRMILATKEPLHNQSSIIEQVKVKDRFPMGYEKSLIKAVLGLTLENGEYPSKKVILVLNVQTVLAISELILNQDNNALINSRYITVADIEAGKAVVARVQFGMKVKDIINQIYPAAVNSKKLYAGDGALSCHSAGSSEAVTDKTNLIAIANMPDYQSAGSCKGCGACVMSCPAGVRISKIVQYIDKNGKDPKECAKFYPELCISCGACTYVCSAGKDTRAAVAWAKNNAKQ